MVEMYKVDEMILGLTSWLKSVDYRYYECNYVPEGFFTKNEKINVIIRTIFRLLPFNLRRSYDINEVPLTPQSNVALLKAYSIIKDEETLKLLYQRVLYLRSPKTKFFSLKQGIRISVRLYENSADDPTPLNTVWFGQFLLDEQSGVISNAEKKELIISIANYLVYELGYVDHGEDGVYFYYGPTLKKEVYNASAVMSAYLIKVGKKYGSKLYLDLGKRGIKYIVKKQNVDGSWFYAGFPERKTIDCFHQSYILQSLFAVKEDLDFNIDNAINCGVKFYYSMFRNNGKYTIPIRYDKRFTPHNTWLFVKVDGRDIADALVFFSKYYHDEKMLSSLISYLYDNFYFKRCGFFSPELFIYGKNRIPYIEFQAWFLYSLFVVKYCDNENNFCIS